MAAEQHNKFVTRAIGQLAPELLAQGTFEEQRVALESIVAGLFATTIILGNKTQRDADTYLSALTHGVRGRLPKLLKGNV